MKKNLCLIIALIIFANILFLLPTEAKWYDPETWTRGGETLNPATWQATEPDKKSWEGYILPGIDVFTDQGTGPYESHQQQHPVLIIARIISIILTFLGISFVGLMIYAGFTWMLAGGNKEKVTKATSIIRGAVIGLAMVLAAYAITTFIYQSFLTRIN